MGFLGRYYRTYALDFWGFGESGRKRETYAVQDFVSLVNQFMDQLGIVNAPLVGHSMGGTVSLSVAIRYPERVSKVVVVGSPMVGSSLSPLLKLLGLRPVGFMLFNMMGVFRAGMRVYSPFICRDPRFPDMMDRDLTRTTLESFLRSIGSLRRTDLRPLLDQIKVPAMGIYGAHDVVVSPNQIKLFDKYIPHGKTVLLKKAGHFPMWDTPQEFNEQFQAFMDM